MDVKIENTKVLIDNQEITGFKKYLILSTSYLLVPFIVAFALLIGLLISGIALTLVIPIVVGAFIFAGVVIAINRNRINK